MELQVGDVVTIDNKQYRIGSEFSGYSQDIAYCEVTESRVQCSKNWLATKAKTIHRPTPEGFVQVWPEVNG